MAYSADKGEKLYEINAGLGNGMGPPNTFSVDGGQYAAVSCSIGPGHGGSGRGPAPAAVLKPQLLVFTLDGKAELPKAGLRLPHRRRTDRTCNYFPAQNSVFRAPDRSLAVAAQNEVFRYQQRLPSHAPDIPFRG